jgi:hypothetical protein
VITLLPRIEYEYKKMNWMVQIINVSKCVMWNYRGFIMSGPNMQKSSRIIVSYCVTSLHSWTINVNCYLVYWIFKKERINEKQSMNHKSFKTHWCEMTMDSLCPVLARKKLIYVRVLPGTINKVCVCLSLYRRSEWKRILFMTSGRVIVIDNLPLTY